MRPDLATLVDDFARHGDQIAVVSPRGLRRQAVSYKNLADMVRRFAAYLESRGIKKGDRVLCYHSAPERSLYSIAEVTRDPYPDPHDYDGKNLVADLRAFEKLPRPVALTEMRANPALKKVKLLKNVRLIISPISDAEYQELLRMAGIVAMPGVPLP